MRRYKINAYDLSNQPPPKIMDDLILVREFDVLEFRKACDTLWNDGYRPLFPHVVTPFVEDENAYRDLRHGTLFTQQWHKPTQFPAE